MRWRRPGLTRVFSRRMVRAAAARRRRLAIEALEGRALLATLPEGFAETVIATGLNAATAMEIAPNGDLWVLEQGGGVKRFGAGTATADIVADLGTLGLDPTGERGLLGIAFDPQYAANKFVYLYYTATLPFLHNRISRFTVNDAQAADYYFAGTSTAGDAGSSGTPTGQVIFELDALSGATNHNGGAIHFGPDGKLYAAIGDNANGANAQTLSNTLGKMLRINSDGSIPSDNPFFNQAGGEERAIWALGLRNPYTFTFQPGTGRMFINDVGQNTWEEINEGLAGANYGWPGIEGNQGTPPSGPGTYAQPLYVYSHGGGPFQGFAITGGAFYNPAANQFPAEFAGDYFFADFVSDWINVRDAASGQVSQFATGASGAVDLRVASNGSLIYLARNQGQALRVTFANTNNPPFAAPDSFSMLEDGTLTVEPPGILANDFNVAGGPPTAMFVSGPARGTLTLMADGSFTYRPIGNYHGLDEFQYRISDLRGTSEPAVVTITIAPVNDPPSFVAGPNQNAADTSGPRSISNWATAITPGPANEAGQGLQFELSSNNPALFAVQPAIDSSGRLNFTPAVRARGTATVTVRLRDDGGTANGGADLSAPQTFTISVVLEKPWHNFANPEDVDGDNEIAAIDAVLIINYINAKFPAAVPPEAAAGPDFLDVSGDNFVSPIDAVLVINLLNARAVD